MKKRKMPEAESREDVVYFYASDGNEKMGAKWTNGKVHTWIEKVNEEEEKPTLPKITKIIFKLLGLVLVFLVVSSGFQYPSEDYTRIITVSGTIITVILVLEIIFVYRNVYKKESLLLRSKHSAEHRIINFMIKNDKIPSTEELEKSNRFTLNCGGLDGECTFEEITSTLISSIISCVIGVNVADYITYYYYGEKLIFLEISEILIMIGIDIILANIAFIILLIISQVVTTSKVTRESDRKLLIELAKCYMDWQEKSSNIKN